MTRALLRRFKRDRRGAVAIEAALSFVLFSFMTLGGLDVMRYYQILGRLERSATVTADMIGRGEAIRDRVAFDATSEASDVGTYFALAAMTAEPEALTTEGGVAIAALTGATGAPVIHWLRSTGPSVGGVDDRMRTQLTDLPTGMPFIAVEISLPFETLIMGSAGSMFDTEMPGTLRRLVVVRPRGGSLEILEPSS
jgi:Flp pilus assembly protein TadG